MGLQGTTVTPDTRKGMLLLRKSEDGLMHLIWKDRTSNTVEDDLIIFQGDATLKHVPQCKDGFVMLLEFTTGRRLFFWSQEPRKKGTGFESAEDIAKEQELMKKANDVLNGNVQTAAAPAALGFGGMTHSELMAMLSGTTASAAPAASSPSAEPPTATAPAASTDVPASVTAPASAAVPSEASAPAPAAVTAAESTPAVAASAAFSAADISNILGTILPPSVPAATAASATPTAATGGGPFSAAAISSILGNIVPPATPPVSVNEVISAGVQSDAAMEERLAEHLPTGTEIPETVTETLNTPQLQQAAMRFTEALHTGDAAGLITELGLNPAGVGVEPFLRALQAATPAVEPMDTSADGTPAPAPASDNE